MNTYFLTFIAAPSEDNEDYGKIKGVYAHFWVLDKSPENAQIRAHHYLRQYNWTVQGLEQAPVETLPEHFADRETGLANYHKAQQWGIAVSFAGWPTAHPK
ncbi:hypothetical protein ACFLZM_05825 [Thermodesulfobacteriota bacterium]